MKIRDGVPDKEIGETTHTEEESKTDEEEKNILKIKDTNVILVQETDQEIEEVVAETEEITVQTVEINLMKGDIQEQVNLTPERWKQGKDLLMIMSDYVVRMKLSQFSKSV